MENRRNLYQMANELLASAGYDINGRNDSEYQQSMFESRMQTGAYSTNQSKCSRRYK